LLHYAYTACLVKLC
jgi:hypothetical protein